MQDNSQITDLWIFLYRKDIHGIRDIYKEKSAFISKRIKQVHGKRVRSIQIEKEL